jgi:hypothetical protein
MSSAIVTRSAEGAAAFTPAGVPRYVPIESGRRVVSSRVPIADATPDETIEALRKRLRDNPKDQ